MGSQQPEFAYPWWLSYGHLCLTLAAAGLWWIAARLRWPFAVKALVGAFGLWAFTAFAVIRFVVNINGVAPLPTERFLAAGTGRVLDIGAGTGRSSMMLLAARPNATLVALDEYGHSYEEHFGEAGAQGPGRFMANLRTAGYERRAEVKTGDMRELPFEAATFDGIVSAYAIDHLNRVGIDKALGESLRVLKPGGEFLLMLVGKDPWIRFAFGPLLAHGGLRGPDWWKGRIEAAGYRIEEQGFRPATLYFLARKP